MLREKERNELKIRPFDVSNENAFNDIVKVLKELFSNEELKEMKEMLFEVNKLGMNSFHIAVAYLNETALKIPFQTFK